MLFLSFQEFLIFFSLQPDAYTKEELFEHYYEVYCIFASKHHMYTNGFDVHREWCAEQKIEN